MPDLAVLLQACLIGLSIAAPVGPIGLLCIERSIARGPAAGFIAGLGAAAADGVYGALAGFGVTAVTSRLIAWQTPIGVAGGIILAVIAWRILRATEPADTPIGHPSEGLMASFLSVFLLTLANPATILSFVAIFSSLGASLGAQASPVLIVAGVFVGSAAWWLILAIIVGGVRGRLSSQARRWIRIGSAGTLAAFALWSIIGSTW